MTLFQLPFRYPRINVRLILIQEKYKFKSKELEKILIEYVNMLSMRKNRITHLHTY